MAPIDILDEQAYNLRDFVEEFSDFNSYERNSLFGCENISKNLIRTVQMVNCILRIKYEFVHIVILKKYIK